MAARYWQLANGYWQMAAGYWLQAYDHFGNLKLL
jgi:hypothetical protein